MLVEEKKVTLVMLCRNLITSVATSTEILPFSHHRFSFTSASTLTVFSLANSDVNVIPNRRIHQLLWHIKQVRFMYYQVLWGHHQCLVGVRLIGLLLWLVRRGPWKYNQGRCLGGPHDSVQLFRCWWLQQWHCSPLEGALWCQGNLLACEV